MNYFLVFLLDLLKAVKWFTKCLISEILYVSFKCSRAKTWWSLG